MVCPYCASYNVQVADTIHGDDNRVYRRRKCFDCRGSFRSIEHIIDENGPEKETFTKVQRTRDRRVRGDE